MSGRRKILSANPITESESSQKQNFRDSNIREVIKTRLRNV